MMSIFVSYRHSRYSFSPSLSFLALISLFSFTLRHYLSHDYHSLYICVYVVFITDCLSARTLTSVDVCSCGIYFIISFSLCCLSVVCIRTCACQRDKQLILAYLDGRIVISPNVFLAIWYRTQNFK